MTGKLPKKRKASQKAPIPKKKGKSKKAKSKKKATINIINDRSTKAVSPHLKYIKVEFEQVKLLVSNVTTKPVRGRNNAVDLQVVDFDAFGELLQKGYDLLDKDGPRLLQISKTKRQQFIEIFDSVTLAVLLRKIVFQISQKSFQKCTCVFVRAIGKA